MKFSQLINQLKNISVETIRDFDVTSVILDSRQSQSGAIFAALKGVSVNGEDFISSAVTDGAKAVLVSKDFSREKLTSVNYIYAEDISQSLADICMLLYTPKPENIIAVTGTNGKTSVANFCAKILSKLNKPSAAIGTLGVCYNGDFPSTPEASLTTPDIISLHKTLQKLKGKNIDYVAFEASSHGLEQGRALGVNIKVAGFTNLTQDHLDYHKTMENYFAAKQKLFSEILPSAGIAVLNADSEYFAELASICKKRAIEFISYGKKTNDVKLVSFTSYPSGQQLEVVAEDKRYIIKTNLIGSFQSYNLLCAIGMVRALGFNYDEIINACANINSVRGRMEYVAEKNGGGIIIDYAHTPDALEKALHALKPHASNRLIALFGCGGDRDKSKRPLMGRVAAENADHVVVTDDNPRTEDADSIRQQIMAACPQAENIPGRRNAIKHSIEMLQPGDILLLAGKGHEDYQIVGKQKNYFNEVEIVNDILAETK